jgi:hypothetical protein
LRRCRRRCRRPSAITSRALCFRHEAAVLCLRESVFQSSDKPRPDVGRSLRSHSGKDRLRRGQHSVQVRRKASAEGSDDARRPRSPDRSHSQDRSHSPRGKSPNCQSRFAGSVIDPGLSYEKGEIGRPYQITLARIIFAPLALLLFRLPFDGPL